jgi:hypothetical protein
MDEPQRHRIDPEFSNSCLAACRRIVQTVHALRVEAERGLKIPKSDETVRLLDAFDTCMDVLARRLDDPRQPPADFALRQRYASAAARLQAERSPTVIALHFDELVDAINTLAGIVSAHAAGTG